MDAVLALGYFLQGNKTKYTGVQRRRNFKSVQVLCEFFLGWTGWAQKLQIAVGQFLEHPKYGPPPFNLNFKPLLKCKGSLQIKPVEKFGLLSQLRGGGLPIPNFDSIFPRVFLLQYGRGSPVPTNKITKNHIKNHQSPKKCDFSMKK